MENFSFKPLRTEPLWCWILGSLFGLSLQHALWVMAFTKAGSLLLLPTVVLGLIGLLFVVRVSWYLGSQKWLLPIVKKTANFGNRLFWPFRPKSAVTMLCLCALLSLGCFGKSPVDTSQKEKHNVLSILGQGSGYYDVCDLSSSKQILSYTIRVKDCGCSGRAAGVIVDVPLEREIWFELFEPEWSSDKSTVDVESVAFHVRSFEEAQIFNLVN